MPDLRANPLTAMAKYFFNALFHAEALHPGLNPQLNSIHNKVVSYAS